MALIQYTRELLLDIRTKAVDPGRRHKSAEAAQLTDAGGSRPGKKGRQESAEAALRDTYPLKETVASDQGALNHRPGRRDVQILCLNVRSISKHSQEIWDLLDDLKPDVCLFTETWLQECATPVLAVAFPENYSIIRLDRVGKRGGGLLVAARDPIQIRSVDAILTNHMELLVFQLVFQESPTYRGAVVYHPPGENKQVFCTSLLEALAPHILLADYFFLGGDFNHHLEDISNTDTRSLLAAMDSLGLGPMVSGPTHRAGHTLDMIFSNIAEPDVKQPLDLTWTDHALLNLSFQQSIHNYASIAQVHTGRAWKKINPEVFKLHFNPPGEEEKSDANRALEKWEATLCKAFDAIAPIKTLKNNRKRAPAPWHSAGLKEEKGQCRALERKWRKTKTEEDKTLFKSAHRRYLNNCKIARRNFLGTRIREAKNSTQELFKILREFTETAGRNPPVTPSQEICEGLAHFFKDKIDKIYNNIENKRISRIGTPANNEFREESEGSLEIRGSPVPKLEAFAPITAEQVATMLAMTKSGSPADMAPPGVMAALADPLSISLTEIYNVSIKTSVFPLKWKKAYIKPLLKKPSADVSEMKNYRPISLLPIFSKVMEKFINNQLIEHLEHNNLLDPSQSGFRTGCSTEAALVEVTDNIRLHLDKGTPTMLVLLDLSAAFDTISHNILLRRLKECGVEGKALAWLRSFLSNRLQLVKMDSFESTTSSIDKGVPQGSILSPTLFNVYVAPLANIIRNSGFHSISYADDTQIIVPFEADPTRTREKFKHCMIKVAEWMENNFLQLNTGKTEILLFGKADTMWSDDWWPRELGHTPTPSIHARNLGVILDNKLTLEDHVNSLSGTCFGIMRMLNKTFPWLPLEARQTLIQALIVSRLDYGNALLVGARADLLAKMQVVQNMAARMALQKPRRQSAVPLLKALHWLPIKKRGIFKLLTMAFKAKQGQGPVYLRNKILPYMPGRQLRSSKSNLLQPCRIRKTRAGGRAFSYLAPFYWNKLPPKIQNCDTLFLFKKQLKTWLFQE